MLRIAEVAACEGSAGTEILETVDVLSSRMESTGREVTMATRQTGADQVWFEVDGVRVEPANWHWYPHRWSGAVLTADAEEVQQLLPSPPLYPEDGPVRDELYAKLVAIMGQFAEYEIKTNRRIPVIVLERADRRAAPTG